MPRGRRGPVFPKKRTEPRPGSRANPLRVPQRPECHAADANCGHIWERFPTPGGVVFVIAHIVDRRITAAIPQSRHDSGPRCRAGHLLSDEAKFIDVGRQCRAGTLGRAADL